MPTIDLTNPEIPADFDLTKVAGEDLDTPIPYRPTATPDAVSRLLVPTTVLLLRGHRQDLLRAVEARDEAAAVAAWLAAADVIGRAIEALEGHL